MPPLSCRGQRNILQVDLLDISNQTRNQLVKVSSNDTINRSAGTREATIRYFYGKM
jgi:hypothetical protein